MFSQLYLDTTNPQMEFREMLSGRIMWPLLVSVVFHTVVYVGFANVVSYVFLGKVLDNAINGRLIGVLLAIMFFGFFARYLHVKEICAAYGGDLAKTRKHVDKLYIGWIFIS